WFGEEFNDAPGKTTSHQFQVPIPGRLTGQPVRLVSNLASRSVGSAGSFDIRLSGLPLQQINIPPVSAAIGEVFAREQAIDLQSTVNQHDISVQYNYSSASFNAQGWLNWFRVFARAGLVMPVNGQLSFRDWQSVGNSRGNFRISNAQVGIMVWDITHFHNAENMAGERSGNTFQFSADCNTLKEYIAFYPNQTSLPEAIGRVQNQDLHQIS